jgi:hypothetical protein
MAIGVVALYALVILGHVVGLPGGSFSMVGSVIGFVGWAVVYVAATVGLGAVVMSKFGTKAWEPKPPVAVGAVPAAPASGPQGTLPPTAG